MRKVPQLYQIDHNSKITGENSEAFLFHLQNALLLALQESGMLTDVQYRHAANRLKQRRLNRAKTQSEKGTSP